MVIFGKNRLIFNIFVISCFLILAGIILLIGIGPKEIFQRVINTRTSKETEEEFKLTTSKTVWQADEEPEFKIIPINQNPFEKIDKKISSKEELKIKATLISPAGEKIFLQKEKDFQVETHSPTKITIFKPKDFKPGKYHLKINFEKNGKVFEFEQDFSWGVLAINTNKSIYLPGETAYLQMAALTNDGRTICDANLKLEIISPTGSPTYPEIQKSGECSPNNVTDKPDYFAYYQIGEPGTYKMKLTNLDNSYEIEDSFEVRESVPFDVERVGPTRIYPLAAYEMKIKIKANEDFEGFIKEIVPADFIIAKNQSEEGLSSFSASKINLSDYFQNPNQLSNFSQNQFNKEVQIIEWEVKLEKDKTYEFSYNFDAPDISPYIYLIGPLEIGNFQEVRKWQIVADRTTWTESCPAATGGCLGAYNCLGGPGNCSGCAYCSVSCPSRTNATVSSTCASTVASTTCGCSLTAYCDPDYECNGTGSTTCNTPTGACNYTCNSGWEDCNQVTSDGCECNLTSNICVGTTCTPAITISGICKQYDQATNCVNGETVKVAVGSTLQTQTGSTSAGSWSFKIPTPASGAVITVFIDGVADANEAIAVTKYDGTGDITGINLFERHLSIGSDDNQTIANTDLDDYDYSVSGDEDIFYDVDASYNLTMPASGTSTYTDQRLIIKANNTYQPKSAASWITVTTPNLQIPTGAILTADGNTFVLTASGTPFSISGTFTASTSTVNYTGTAATTLAATTYYNLGVGTAADAIAVTYTLGGNTTVSSVLTVGNASSTATDTLAGSSYTLTLSGSGTPFNITSKGNFSAGTSTVKYTGNAATNVAAATYNNLELLPSANAITFTLGTATGQTITTNGYLTIGNGTNTGIINADTNDPILDVNGNFTISANATFVASATGTFTVAGNWSNSGTFTHSNGTVNFDATTTGKTITTGGSAFYNLIFNGTGGEWTIQDATTISNDLTMTAGTLFGTQNVTVNGGDVTGDGIINLTGGTFTLDGAGNFGGATAWTFYNLTIGGNATVETTTATGTGSITVSNVLTIGANQTLNAGSKTWTLSGSGTPFVINGTFTASTSTFKYTGSAATNITATTYNNLELLPSANAITFTLGTATGQTITTNNLTIGNGTNTGTINADTYDPTLDVNGNFTISANATFVASATGTFTVAGNWSNSGTFTHSNGTVTFDGTSQQTLSGTMTGSSAFYNLTITNNSGTDPDTSPSVIFSASATATTATFTTASTKLRFNAGSTYTFTNINFNGGATTTRVTFRSSSSPTQWNLVVTGTQSVSYVDTKDSNASGGNTIDATNGTNLNSGNNTNWSFALPVASSVSIDSGAVSVTLNEGTTKNVVCTATVTDNDGYSQITNVQAKFYRTGVGAGAADDNNNHYTLSGSPSTYCTGSGTSGNCTFTFAVCFYADPTDTGSPYETDDWTCQVTPSDGVGAGTAAIDTIEMNSLIALDVTATINYGTLALGANTGTTDTTTTVTNTGNRQIDIQLDGYGSADGDGKAMVCTIGSIPIGNERYSLTAATDWSTKTQLTDTATTLTTFDLAKGASSTKNVYWGLGIPSTGVGGSCSGKVNFTAVSG